MLPAAIEECGTATMPDWLDIAFRHIVKWLLARSVAEALLFVICIYLVVIARRLTYIMYALEAVWNTMLKIQGYTDIVKGDVRQIKAIAQETMFATQSSGEAKERIRTNYGPTEDEIKQKSFEQDSPPA